MAVLSLLLIGLLLWVSGSASRPNADAVDMQTTDASTDGKDCTSSSECGSNQFCSGRGKFKRCVLCYDCSLVERKQRFNYDGIMCATHPSECGACNEGYEEIGGVCAPQVTTTTYASVKLDAFAYLKKANAEDGLKEVFFRGPLFYVLILLLVTAFVCLLYEKQKIFSYFQRCNFSKALQLKPSEDISSLACTERAPFEQPSAPPYLKYVESFREPNVPHTVGSFATAQSSNGNNTNSYRSISSPLIIPIETQQAVPFNPGNLASNYIFESDTESINEVNVGVDEVDNGNGPESQSSQANDVPNHSDRSNENRPNASAQSHQHTGSSSSNGASASFGSTSYEPNQSRRDTQDQQVQTCVEVQGLEGASAESPNESSPNADSNPVMFRLGLNVQLALLSTPQTSNRNPPSTENPATTTSRYVASDPVSHRIDDLIVLQPLTEFRGTYAASNLSVDSGGETDPERSRTSSGVDIHPIYYDYMDDSLYDYEGQFDPAASPSLPDHDLPPLVPDFDELDQEENTGSFDDDENQMDVDNEE